MVGKANAQAQGNGNGGNGGNGSGGNGGGADDLVAALESNPVGAVDQLLGNLKRSLPVESRHQGDQGGAGAAKQAQGAGAGSKAKGMLRNGEWDMRR